jgi:thiaminase/transcriptional activator TenA
MSFSEDAWASIGPLYDQILAQPFNRELAAGTLSRERFTFYMLQDSHYLLHFGRALAVTAAKAPYSEAMVQLAGAARECIVVERALHEGFFRDFGIDPETAAATEPSPTCSHYTSYLLSTAHNAPYEVALGALLPCFWIYREVGKHLLEIAAPDNPYQAWIDTYADEDFAAGVRAVIGIADQAAATATPVIQGQMLKAFRRASELEYLFWDSAYRLEAWPTADWIARPGV